MIISHRKKFAFFANPKTGSKAAGIMLRLAGVFDENDILTKQPFLGTRTADIRLPAYNADDIPAHLTPAEAVTRGLITLDQLREYDCFAYLRDSEDRYHASRIAMTMNRHGQISNGRPYEQPHTPQHMYILVDDEQVITPLDFNNYKEGIERMYAVLDAPFMHVDIPYIDSFRVFKQEKYAYNPLQHTKDIILHKTMVKENEIHNR